MIKYVKSGFVFSGDALIHYKLFGEGKPLIFLHGNSENLKYFEPQIDYFSQQRLVVAIDSRGHGRSTFGFNGDISLDIMSDDLIAVLDELEIESADILGFSDGGNIALTTALKYPGRIDSLVITGANLNPKGVKTLYQLPIVAAYGALSLGAIISKRVRKIKDIWGLMVKEPSINPGDLTAITAPTLLIAGEKDMIRDDHTRLIHQAIEGSELVIVPNATHFVSKKMPEVFNRAVDDFLQSIYGSGKRSKAARAAEPVTKAAEPEKEFNLAEEIGFGEEEAAGAVFADTKQN